MQARRPEGHLSVGFQDMVMVEPGGPPPRKPRGSPVGSPAEADSSPAEAGGITSGGCVSFAGVNPPGADGVAVSKKDPTWQQRLNLLLEEPTSSRVATLVSYTILGTICASVVSFVLETEPGLKSFFFDFMEVFSTALFTVEYVSRLVVCNASGKPTRCEFVRAPMNVLDLVAIAPFYVELVLSSVDLGPLRVLRSVRLIRIFRVFRLSKYSVGMTLLVKAVAASVKPLAVLCFFLGTGVFMYSTLVYYAEKMHCPKFGTMSASRLEMYNLECTRFDFDSEGYRCCNEHGSAIGFESILATSWWSIVTMCTVGYGDVYPATKLGQIIGACTMLSGIVLISLPVAIVGSEFQELYEKTELETQRLAKEATRKEETSKTGVNFRSASKRLLLFRSKTETTMGNVPPETHERAARRLMTAGARAEPAASRAVTTGIPGPCHSTPTPVWLADARRRTSVTAEVHLSGAAPQAFAADVAKLPAPARATVKTAELRNQLRLYLSRGTISVGMREQIQLSLQLLDHITQTEAKLKDLTERDTKAEEKIAMHFGQICRLYENHHNKG